MTTHSSRDAARVHWIKGLREELTELLEKGLARTLSPVNSPQGPHLTVDGRAYVQFCTNNYLGLANDPEVVEAAREATTRFGVGAGASRLVAGSMELHHQLEEGLARFKGVERALVFPTGFMANLAVLTTLAGERDQIVSDKWNHASLLDAAKFSGAWHRTFPHRRYERAKELLQRDGRGGNASAKESGGAEEESVSRDGLRYLVTDSIFSMDGDAANLPAACDAAEAAGALVIIDEAHGSGVLGVRGRGLAELQGVEERVAITVGTLSKAFGSVGGFVAADEAVIETLVHRARPFIYTTGLPPACSAASLAALRIIEREPARRERVLAIAFRVKAELTALGFACGDSTTPIIPVMIGSAEDAVGAASFLRERGLYVPAIRPPTVPPGSARLRISVMATHSDEDVSRLLEAMRALRDVHFGGRVPALG